MPNNERLFPHEFRDNPDSENNRNRRIPRDPFIRVVPYYDPRDARAPQRTLDLETYYFADSLLPGKEIPINPDATTLESGLDYLKRTLKPEKLGKLQHAGLIDRVTSNLTDIVRVRAAIGVMLDYMPDAMFDQMIQPEQDGVSIPLDKLYGRLLGEIFTSRDENICFSKGVEYAYGMKSNNRFAATAALYAYTFITVDSGAATASRLTDVQKATLKEKLEHHSKKHTKRMAQLEVLNGVLPETIKVGLELEMDPKNFDFSEIKQIQEQANAVGAFIRSLNGDLYRNLCFLTDDFDINNRFIERQMGMNKELRKYVENFIALKKQARQKGLDFNAKMDAVLGLSGWKRYMEGNIYEYQSFETADEHLLAHEIIMFRKLGYIQYKPEEVNSNNVRYSHTLHLNTGGLKVDLGRDEDIALLHHTSEATAYASAFNYNHFKYFLNTQNNKGEIYDKGHSQEFKQTGNKEGAEQRSFCAYNERHLVRLILQHGNKARAAAAFQALPKNIKDELHRLSNVYIIPEYKNEGEFYGRVANPYLWKSMVGNLDTGVSAVLKDSDISPLHKDLVTLWSRYRFLSGAIFRTSVLPNPFIFWGYQGVETSERAALWNRINDSMREWTDFFRDSHELEGREISLGASTHPQFISAMRDLDLAFGVRVKNTIHKAHMAKAA
jgi:hypothetical protein